MQQTPLVILLWQRLPVGSNNLTLSTGDNIANSDITASGAIAGLGNLILADVGGTATFSNNVAAAALTAANTVANITFTGGTNTFSAASTLANDGTLTFGDATGDSFTFNGGLNTSSVAGTVTLNTSISSSDDALIFGAITLGNNVTIDTNSTTTNRADITVAAITGGNNTLTLTTENNVTGSDITENGAIAGVTTLTLASVGGTATLSADVDVTTLAVDNTVANVAFIGNGSSVVNAVAFANDGTLTLGTNGGTQTYNGGLNTTSVGGTVTLNGSIVTSNDAVVLGAVTLGSATTVDTNSSDTTGDITIGAVTGGSNSLTLSTGDNVANTDISASGAISGVTTLTLADVGGTATLSGDVDVTTLTVGNTVANLAFTGNGSSVANAVTFANDGTLILGTSGGTQTYNGGLNTTGVGGTVTLNGTIASSDDAIVLGAVTLGSATTVDTNSTNTAGDITLGAVTGGSNSLTLSTGNNVANTDISASGTISGVTTLTLSDVGGTAILSADVDVTTLTVGNTVANLIFSGNGSSIANAVTFANDGTLTLGGSNVIQTFAGGFNTDDVGGAVTLQGTAIGNDDFTFGDLTLDNSATLSLAAGKVLTFEDDLNVGSNTLTVTADEINFTGGANSVVGTGNLTLKPVSTGHNMTIGATSDAGTGSIDILDSDIAAIKEGFSSVILGTSDGTGSLTISSASFKDAVVIQMPGNGASVTINGQLDTLSSTANNTSASITIIGPGSTTTLNEDIITPGAAIDIRDSVIIASGANILLDTTNGGAVAGGAAIDIEGSLNGISGGSAETLRLNAGTGGAITVNSSSGTTGGSVPLNITILNSGGTTFNQSVSALTVDLQATNGTILFQGNTSISTLTTALAGYNLSLTGGTNTFTNEVVFQNTGTLNLGNAAGDSFTFNGGVTEVTSGAVTLASTISSSNDAISFGAVTLGANTTIDTNSSDTTGDITIGAVTGGSNSLTLSTGDNVANTDISASGAISGVTTLTLADVGGTATLSGDVDVTTLAVDNTVANVAFIGNGSSVVNAVAFANDGTLTLGTNGGTQTYNGGLNTTSVGGTVTLNGSIVTSNDAVVLGAVTLGSATTVDTNSSDTTGDITIGAVTGGSNSLTLSTGDNVANTDISASGAISGVTTLTLADVGGTATLSGDVDVTTLTVGNTVANLAFTGNGSSVANAVTFANDGTLILGTSGGTQTYNGGLNTTGVGGTVTLNGTIASSNDAVVLGAVTLGSNTVVDTNATNTTGDITIAAITGGSNNLTLSTGDNIGNSDITANGAISGVTTLTLSDVGGTATLSADVDITTLTAIGNTVANIVFSGDGSTVVNTFTPIIDGTLTLGTSGGTQTWTGGINGINRTGETILNGTIQSSNAAFVFGNITLNSNSIINTNATGQFADIFVGAITGNNNSLTLSTGNNISGADIIISFIDASGSSGIDALTLSNIGGTVSFPGSVSIATLSANNTVANITFTGSTNTFSGAATFANDGTLTFGDATGDSFTFNGGLNTSSVAGTVTLNTSISSSNDAMVFGAITLGNNVTLDTNATNTTGDLTLGVVTGGSNTLTLSTGDNVANSDITASGNISGVTTLTLADVGGTATLSADVDVTTLAVDNTVANVAFTGNGSSVVNSFTPDNDGTFIFGASGGTQTYNGGLNTASVDGTVTLNGTIATSNDAVVLGAVTLGSATTIDTNATDTAGDITVAAITGGSNNLTLSTGDNIANSDITASGAIAGLGNLILADVGGTATFSNNVAAAALTAANTVANITFTGGTNTFSAASTLANDGTLTFGDATGDSFTFNGGLNTSSVAGTVTLNTSISSSNDAMVFGAITLGNNVTLDTNASNTTGDLTLGVVTGGSNTLTLSTGDNVNNSDITASGNISGVTTLNLQDIGGTATLSGDVDVTTLGVTNTVANLVFSGNGSSVANVVEFINDGTLTLGTSGGTQTYNGGGLTTTGVGSTVTLNGTIATSNDAVVLGAVTLGSATTS